LGATRRQRGVVKRAYVPEPGDLIWLTFDPQTGREQRGRRPALVLSPRIYNERSELAIVCPITSKVKRRMFEVSLPPGGRIEGAVLVNHLKSLDWKQRRAELAGKTDASVLEEVRERIRPLVGL
jgi:mRNA interferase MazF